MRSFRTIFESAIHATFSTRRSFASGNLQVSECLLIVQIIFVTNDRFDTSFQKRKEVKIFKNIGMYFPDR